VSDDIPDGGKDVDFDQLAADYEKVTPKSAPKKTQAPLSTYESEIIKIDEELDKERGALKRQRNRYWWSLGIFILSLMFLTIYTYHTPVKSQTVLLVILSLIIAIATMLFAMQLLSASSQRDIDTLEARKKTLQRLAGISEITSEKTTYFDRLVEINIDNLGAYYALVKAQADRSFMASIVVAFVGFFLISVGLAIGITNTSNTLTITYISSGSGVITEFIAGVFFYLYNKTVIQMKGYHDSLLTVQNVLLSFKIIGDIQKEDDRIKMVGQMLTYLVGVQKHSYSMPLEDEDISKSEPKKT
jgi:Cyanobacterial TRADD-N associated 2-Transmembrane domain